MNIKNLLLPILSIKAKFLPPPTVEISMVDAGRPIHFALHSGESSSGKDHLNTWVPLFQKAQVNFLILTRTKLLFAYAKKNFPSVPTAYAKSHSDLEKVFSHLDALHSIFYLSNTANAALPVRFNNFTHIFLGHGDSEKSPSVHKVFRMYDEIWVAGQAHIDRFANAGFDTGHITFVKIGRPMLQSFISQTDSRPWRQRFRQLNLCYLPTWEGVSEKQNYSSLPLGKKILTGLYENYPGSSCKIKLHPISGSRVKDFRKYEASLEALKNDYMGAITVVPKSRSALTAMVTSNVIICDVSSIITDGLLMDVPIFVYIAKGVQTAESNIPLDSFAYTFSNEDELLLKASRVLNQGDDYLASGRTNAKEYCLGLSHIVADAFLLALHKRNASNTREIWKG